MPSTQTNQDEILMGGRQHLSERAAAVEEDAWYTVLC